MRFKKAIFLLMLIFYTQNLFAIAYYDIYDVNPGLVHAPLVLDYVTCKAKWGFCSCRLTGIKDKQKILDMFDANKDGILSKVELQNAIKNGFLNDSDLGNSNYMACWYDPPSPGPYQQDECVAIFGANDCICQNTTPEGYKCYSVTAVETSPTPVKIPKAFCKAPNGYCSNSNCFDCFCPETETGIAGTSSVDTCYVKTQASENYDCLDEVRIFPGKKYDCIKGFGGICSVLNLLKIKCCPSQLKCKLNEHNSGMSLSDYTVLMNYSLKLYTAYKGYASIAATEANVTGFVNSLLTGKVDLSNNSIFSLNVFNVNPISNTSEALENAGEYLLDKIPGISTLKTNFSNFVEVGLANSPALQALTTVFSYAGWINLAIDIIKMIWHCDSSDYELACKVTSRTCLYVGDFTETKGKLCKIYHESWMCYNSQISRIINEYGLPQIYAHNCHEDNCDDSCQDPTDLDKGNSINMGLCNNSCGCKCAYARDCNPKKPRADGFTIDQFEKINFAEIPIDDEIIKIMMGNNLDFKNLSASDVTGVDISNYWEENKFDVSTPAAMEDVAAKSSIETTKEEAKDVEPNNGIKEVGVCDSVFPTANTQEYSIDKGQQYIIDFCINAPDTVKKPRIQYVFAEVLNNSAWACIDCANENKVVNDLAQCPDCVKYANEQFNTCYGKASYFDSPSDFQIAPLYLYYDFSVNTSAYDNCFAEENTANFYKTNVYPMTSFPLVNLFYHTDTSMYGDNYKKSPVLALADDNSFFITYVYSLSNPGINRGKALTYHGDPNYPQYSSINGFVLKDRLLSVKPNPCTHIECDSIVNGEITKVSDQCRDWYNWMSDAVEFSMNANCQVFPKGFLSDEEVGLGSSDSTPYGKEWLVIRNVSKIDSLSLIKGQDWFDSCPDYQTDICMVESGKLPEMVCPRPSRVNLLQKVLTYAGGNAYAKYQSYISSTAYKEKMCWLDPVVANSCSCN